ncbi:MAG: hypothetical protein AAF554_12370 [Bacteroidota bacterium]
MEKQKNIIIGFALLMFTMTTSCKDTSALSSNSEKKQGWTQKERTNFLEGCFSSAKTSFEKGGQTPDKELITKICICAGKELEAKYGSFEEMSKVNSEEMRNIMVNATKKCASE